MPRREKFIEAGRDSGIGKQLLEVLIEFARSIGSPVVMLHALPKLNEFAAAFFLRGISFRADNAGNDTGVILKYKVDLQPSLVMDQKVRELL